MRIGNDTRQVREFLRRHYEPRPDPAARPLLMLPEPVSRWERAHFGVECPRPDCGSKRLCIAPTGLPASGPHAERTLLAFFADDFLEPLFDDDRD
jgi:hypothetical protein